MFQTKVGTVLTEAGVEVQEGSQTAEAEVQTSDPAILQKIIIEFVINPFCIPLL